MYPQRRRLIELALSLTLFAAAIPSLPSSARSQESVNRLFFPEGADPDGLDRLTRIEQHLQKLEDHNRRLQKSYADLYRKYEQLLRYENNLIFGKRAGNADGMGIPGGINLLPSSFLQEKESSRKQTGLSGAGEETGGKGRVFEPEEEEEKEGEEATPLVQPPTELRRRQTGASGAGEVIEPFSPSMMADFVGRRGAYQPDMRPYRMPADVSFREGLQIRAADDFFTFEFHNLTQVDYRDFSQTGAALHDNFDLPRQRWYFQGQLSPYAYYYTVINRGYGSLDILDTWTDLNFAPQYKQQLQFRVGRMKTPFTYEYFKIAPSDLIAPERSLFVTNFAPNRQLGAMMHGYLFENVMEYYAGVFNGPRKSFQGFDNSKTFFGMVNFKPFLHSGIEWLEQLNITGSINGGTVLAPVQPVALTTAADQSAASSAGLVNVSPTFLIFNPKTFENGSNAEWAFDVAYYYNGLSLLANYEGGYQDYSLQGSGTLPSATAYGAFASGAFVGVGNSKRTAVPLSGWSVAAAYFLTGEQITRRVYLVEPRRPFGYYNGRLNPGAFESYFRFANLQLGDQVFSSGFANPADWANRVSTTDTGINWYLNHYVRITFDWQHAFYNQAVFMSDTKSSKHNDLYWIRFRLFF